MMRTLRDHTTVQPHFIWTRIEFLITSGGCARFGGEFDREMTHDYFASSTSALMAS